MKKRKRNWPVIVFIVLLIAVLLCVGCLVAGWKLTPIRGTDYTDERNNDVTTSSYGTATEEPNRFIEYVSKPTVVGEFTAHAEIFIARAELVKMVQIDFRNEIYYKDAHRKETIEFVSLSDGTTIMKDKLIDFNLGRSHPSTVALSSLPDYKYKCLSFMNGNYIIYAFNERDINQITGDNYVLQKMREGTSE